MAVDDHVRPFAAGEDPEPWIQELWVRYEAPMVAAARRAIPEADVEDLVARVFERTYRALLSGTGPTGPDANPRGYLYASLRREISAERRRRLHARSLEDLPAAEAEALTATGQDLPGEGDLLAAVLSRFADRDRQLLVEVLGEGRRLRDVADELHLTPPAASRRLYKLRPRLRATWIQAHVHVDRAPEQCRPTLARVGTVLAGVAVPSAEESFWRHVRECERCPAVIAEADAASRSVHVAGPESPGAPDDGRGDRDPRPGAAPRPEPVGSLCLGPGALVSLRHDRSDPISATDGIPGTRARRGSRRDTRSLVPGRVRAAAGPRWPAVGDAIRIRRGRRRAGRRRGRSRVHGRSRSR